MNNHELHPLVPETASSPAVPATELTAEQLRFRVAATVDFRTTEKLSTSHEFVGQKRARPALDLGAGIPNSGYNIFVSGLTGAEHLTALRNWVVQRATQLPTPGDWGVRA